MGEKEVIIEAKNLTKDYGEHTAISDVSFKIEKGRIYGFLGPNGAGKSTTMNIMTGCLSATEGTVSIGGYDIFEEPLKAKKLIGYLPEMPPLYLDRTPREYLKFVAEAKKLKKEEISEQIDKVLELTDTTDVADRLIKNLSKGYKQRVGIAQALLGDPEIVILDEPTVGLDPKQIIDIRQLIKNLGKKHTVILSSHILSEIQAVCDTIIIISKGKLIACDSPDNLEKQFSNESSIKILTEANEKEIMSVLNKIKNIKKENVIITQDGNLSRVKIDIFEGNVNELLKKLFFGFAEIKKAILEMSGSAKNLEDIFIELTMKAEEGYEDEDDEDEEEKDTKIKEGKKK